MPLRPFDDQEIKLGAVVLWLCVLIGAFPAYLAISIFRNPYIPAQYDRSSTRLISEAKSGAAAIGQAWNYAAFAGACFAVAFFVWLWWARDEG
jgi:hypothetical protein